MTQPRISIIVPTRNGGTYINDAVETVLSQDYDSVELIVSVNHSVDGTFASLQRYRDSRLRVVKPPEPLSMPRHFEWCLLQSRGQWITIIGDDDGVMPYFFRELEQVLRVWEPAGVDALCFRRACFFWPGCERFYGNRVVDYSASSKHRDVNGTALVLKCVSGLNPFYDLPHVYTNSLVRRSLIDSIRQRSGGIFFHERNPDVYSGVAVAVAARRIVRIELPMFWTGTSPKSVGLSSQIASTSSTGAAGDHSFNTERATEFHAMAASDSVPVATEIGIDAWKTCASSTLYVASALLSIPFHVPRILRWRKAIVAIAVAGARRELDANDSCYGRKITALATVNTRNGIGSTMETVASVLVRIMHFFFRAVRFAARRCSSLFLVTRVEYPSFDISSRQGLSRLMDAQALVANAFNASIGRVQTHSAPP